MTSAVVFYASLAETSLYCCDLQIHAYTAQKMKFPIKDFSCKCDLIRNFLWIWSHLLYLGVYSELYQTKEEDSGFVKISSIWVKVFKNGPSKICGRQPLKNLK